MTDNEYKIQLGVKLDTSDLKTDINKLDDKYKVKLGVSLKVNDIRDRITQYNQNKNNAKVKLGVKLDTDDLKRQINNLNLGTNAGKGVAIPVNTQSLEDSLKEVKEIISNIQRTLGNVGDGSEMKPLLYSVNQIADALGKVSSESQNVISALNALSKKDFNVNFGINAGGSNNPIARNAAYGNKVRGETLPQLKQQVESLVRYVNDYYKTSYNEFEALQKLVSKTKLGTGDFYQNFLFGEDSVASRMSGGSLAGQMQAFKQYIDMFKQAASLKGLNLDSVTSQFSKTADDLIKDAHDIQTGANEAKDGFEKLKQVFGSGSNLNIEGLSTELKPIVDDLRLIRESVQSLSKDVSIDGLAQSFNRLSETLEKLSGNLVSVQSKLNAMSTGTSSGFATSATSAAADIASATDKIEKDSDASTAAVVQNEKKKQQALEHTADTYENTAKQASQAGKLISDSAQEAIDNVSSKSINRAFTVDEDDSIKFKKEMENLVSQWTDAKGKLTDIKINTETFYDGETGRNIERITSAIVTYNNELGETIRKTIALRQIDTKQTGVKYDKKTKRDVPVYEPVYGFVEISGQYSKSLGKTKAQTDAFVKQQKNAVADLNNTINQLNRSAIDPNAGKPIKDSSHLESLGNQYKLIIDAIQKMGRASNDNDFQEERNNVKTLISEYKSLTREYKNAETSATSFRSKDIDTIKSTYASDLDVLIQKMEDAGVYTSGFEKGAENLRNVLNNATDTSGINAFLNGFDKLEAGYKRAAQYAKSFEKATTYGKRASGLESEIARIQRISPEINQFETEINGAKVSVQSLLKNLSNVKTKADFDSVNEDLKAFKKAAEAAGIAIRETAAKAKSVQANDIKIDIELGKYANDISSMYDKFDKLSGASDELCRSVKMTEAAYQKLMDAANSSDGIVDNEKLIQAQKEYAAVLEKTNNLIKIQTREEKAAAAAQKLAQDKESLKLDTQNWLNENTKAAKEYGAELKRLMSLLDKVDDPVAFKEVARDIKNVQKTAQAMGQTGLTVFDRLKAKAKEYMTYLSAAELFMYAEQALRSMFEQVKLIDSAMTELKKVTDETDASYERFLTNAASRAKEIGTTIDGLVSSTADFARLGYEFADAQGLAEVANIYAVVGDDIDSVETATQSLISTLTAFKDEAGDLSESDFALSIVDKMNEVSNNFAISSGGLGDALQRSASSMMAANNSLDETIALITAANTVVQDADSVGRLMPTLKMAISVKSQRWSRPRKDFISIFDTYQLGRICVFFMRFKLRRWFICQQKVN